MYLVASVCPSVTAHYQSKVFVCVLSNRTDAVDRLLIFNVFAGGTCLLGARPYWGGLRRGQFFFQGNKGGSIIFRGQRGGCKFFPKRGGNFLRLRVECTIIYKRGFVTPGQFFSQDPKGGKFFSS